MAPSPGTEVSTGGAESEVFAELGAILNSPDEPTGESTPSTQTAVTAPAGSAAPAAGAPGTVAQQTPADPYPVSPDGAAYIVPKGEIVKFNGQNEYLQAVQRRYPTVQDAESAYYRASDFAALTADYLSGEPQNIDAALLHLAGNDHQKDPVAFQRYQQSFAKMAQRLPQVLARINPQAHQQFVEATITGAVTAAYDRAAQTGDPADLLKAQRLDWARTGQYKTELPARDPQATARQQQEQRDRELQQREQGLLTRDFENFNTSQLDGAKWQEFDASVDQALAPIKEKFDAAEYADIRGLVRTKLLDTLKGDFEFARNHNIARQEIQAMYAQLWRSRQSTEPLKPYVTAYKNDLLLRARHLLPSIAAPYIQRATARAVAPAAVVNRQPNGQFAPKPQDAAPAANPAAQANGRKHYDIFEDPEFTSNFK